MQNYFNIEDAKLKNQLATDEAALRHRKDQECNKLRASLGPGYKDQEWLKRLQIAVVVIAIIIAIGTGSDFFGGLVLAVILSAVGIICLQNLFGSKSTQKTQQLNAAVQQCEAQYNRDLQNLRDRNKRDRQALADQLNRELNQYVQQYNAMNMTTYLVEWLLSGLSVQISRADRSYFYPQVKTSFSFSVTSTRIQVPGYGDYDMARMGMQITDEPTSLSALAYVLEQMLVKEARRRFAKDPNGGPSNITSTWDKNVTVVVSYEAPNFATRPKP